jgi:hypothetical protein
MSTSNPEREFYKLSISQAQYYCRSATVCCSRVFQLK